MTAKHRARAALLLATALIVCTAGCGKTGITDDALATRIKAALFSDETTKSASVNVAVKDGVVTLTGEVPSSDVELEAMKVANGTAGVKRVDDRMKVTTAATTNPPPAQGSATNSSPQAAPPPPTAVSPPAPATQQPTAEAPLPGSTHGPTPPAPKARPQAVRVTIPAGETVTVRMIDSVDSSRNVEGQVFRASLAAPLTSHERVVVPRGANITVVLSAVEEAGRIKGRSDLEVRLARLEYRGRSYRVVSTSYSEQGKARGEQTAKRTGLGAVAGAVIGAIAGGGKGAAIGTLAGAGAGVGSQAVTHGQRVTIPSETIITFRLKQPLTIEK